MRSGGSDMKRQYDMASILQFFSERSPSKAEAPKTPEEPPRADDALFEEWLDARLRELYADVLAEEIPADMLAAASKALKPP
jgi:hypothetical protein